VASGIDAPERAKARGAMRSLVSSAEGPRLRRSWRRFSGRALLRAGLGLCGLALALAILAAIALFILLATGPINLESLKPRIAMSLEEKFGGKYKVSIGPTSLTRGPSGLGLRFGGIQINDLDGRTVVAAPSGRVGLDIWSLLRLEVKVRRLELNGLVLRLHVRPDGAISVAAAPSTEAAPIEVAPLAAARTAGANPPGPDPAALAVNVIDMMAGSSQALDHVSLANGHLEVENEALGKKSIYEEFTVAFDKGGDDASFSASARGPSGLRTVIAKAHGGADRSISIDARDLGFDDIQLFNSHKPPIDTDMPVSFRFAATLTPEGTMKSLQGGFSLGAGYFRIDDPDDEPTLFDEATGKVSWDPETRRYNFDKIEALAGASHYRIEGWLAPPSGEERAWRAHFQSGDSVLAGERPGETPVAIDNGVFDAHFLPADQRAFLDRFTLHGPHLQAEMTGESTGSDAGPAVKFDLQVGPSAVVDVLRLWPSFLNAEARVWCLEHIHGGDVVSGSMKADWDATEFNLAIHKQAVPPDSVRGDFTLHDAVVTELLPGIPAMTGLDAVGFLTGRVFSVSAKHGVMEFSQGRRMQGTDIFFKVPDTRPQFIVPAIGGAHVTGGADALADLLARDSIKRYAGFSVDPTTVKGQFQGTLALDLGLGKNAHPDDQKFRVETSLSNFALDKYIGNERFEQGALDVVADAGNVKITGQGLFNTVPTKVELTKAGNEDGVLNLMMTLDDAARARLGLNGGPPAIGPMAVHLKAPLNKSAADVDVDLVKVEIQSPEGDVVKPAGKPGKATFTLKYGPDGYAIGAIALDAGAVMARGTAHLGPDGAFQTASLSQLRLYPGDDLKLDLQNGPAMKAVVHGTAFDSRNMVKAFLSHDTTAGGVKDLDIDAKIGVVQGSNKRAIDQLEVLATRRSGAIRTLLAKGQLGDGPVSAIKDESGVFVIRAADAGAFAKFIDFYTKIDGGQLELNVEEGPDGSHGTAMLRKFVIRNEPALRQLSTAGGVAQARGGRGGGEAFAAASAPAPVDPDAVRFDRVKAEFSRAGGRLELKDALIYNPSFGLTAQGYLDYGHDRVDVGGTFVPAYSLNSVVTGIPVVGVILGGGANEGVFGFNYRITGPASGPTLTVNPLSGMAPGIFRKIFGVMDGTAPAGGDAQ
jgi:hypothetical protein